MIEIRRILCPLDRSETSRRALDHAVAIGKWYKSTIIALHVAESQWLPQPMPLADAGLPPSPAVGGIRADELRAWLDPADRAGLGTQLFVDPGNPAARIVERARSEHADMIVMGTHGFSGFERFILGSVTEKVLRKAPCPVLTVPPGSTTSTKVPYTSVLCPVDFSESSLAALQLAASLAKESDARLLILHVVDWPANNSLMAEQFKTPDFQKRVEEPAHNELDGLVTEEMRTYSRPTTRIVYGTPYRQILEAAEKESCDLIVIGVQGRNPLDLAVFGSTTNHVVRSAACPVLTARS